MGFALEVPCSDAPLVRKVHEGFDLSVADHPKWAVLVSSAQSARRGHRARRRHRPALPAEREPAGRATATHPGGLHVTRKVRPGDGHQLHASLTS
jgi:hypothetical protein